MCIVNEIEKLFSLILEQNMARQERPEEVIYRILDKHGIVGEERYWISNTFNVHEHVPGLEQVLDECFATDKRRGMIATNLASVFTCFSEETRQRSFLDLVDAFYDIRDMKTF